MIAFFHQNEVETTLGGIERYLSMLIKADPDKVTLVTERTSTVNQARIVMDLKGPRSWPKWLRYCWGVIGSSRRLRRELAARQVRVLEFSRPEYAIFAWLFPGRRVFTFHGMGGIPHEFSIKRLVHDLACFLLPFMASNVQVVGRDDSALPRPVRAWFGARIVHIDAWYDDRFRPSQLPILCDSPLVIFYSGRLTVEKDPELLFEIIKRARIELRFPVEFRYFGADAGKFKEAGLEVTALGQLDTAALAKAISDCHVGILCSKIEGSPFAMIEALACGRCFVAPPLPGLKAAYPESTGVFFADKPEPRAFLDALVRARDFLMSGASADMIAKGVEPRSQPVMTRTILGRLSSLAEKEKRWSGGGASPH